MPCFKSVLKQGGHFSEISGNLEMLRNLAKVSEKSWKRPKVGERLGNLCSRGNLIVAAEQNVGDRTVVW